MLNLLTNLLPICWLLVLTSVLAASDTKKSAIEDQIAKGNEKLSGRDFGGALKVFTAVLRLNPAYDDALRGAAKVACSLGRTG